MDLKNFESELSKDIESIGYHLFSLDYESKHNVLHVYLDESLDLNQMEVVSEKISAFMDKYDGEFDEYLLDVTSIGAERPIRNETEVLAAVGKYVHVKTKEVDLDGELVKFENNVLTIQYLDKTRKKTISINYKDVKKLRYAVKF